MLLNTQGIEGRMIQAPDGTLFIDSGPLAGRGILSRNWTQSQLPGSLMGKVLHINTDGSIPTDNPFIGRPDTRPEIWAFGVRDAQSMAFDAQGRLWTAENGPMGGDELNLIEKGKNYGFPVITLRTRVLRRADQRRIDGEGRAWSSRSTSGRRRWRPRA